MLKQFIDDLWNHPLREKLLPSVLTEQFDLLKAEAAINNCNLWTEHSPPAGWNDVPFGVMASYYNGISQLSHPTKILPLQSGDFMVADYSAEFTIFSSDWVLKGRLPYGAYGDPQTDDKYYRNSYGAALNADESKLAICCYSDHAVRCFNHATGATLWTFGDGSAGTINDDRAYYPRDCAWLGMATSRCRYTMVHPGRWHLPTGGAGIGTSTGDTGLS